MHEVLSPSTLKKITKNLRACRITDSEILLESKNGSIIFDLSDFGNIEYCTLYFRNKSGNGKIIAISGPNVVEKNILSKISQYFNIHIANSELQIKRPQNSIGVIGVTQIDIFGDTTIEEDIEMSKWKDILNKCSKQKCIKLNKGRLFAAEGGFIEAKKINIVNTDPPNMYVVKDGVVKFKGPCEIIDLIIDGENVHQEFMPHLEAAPEIIINKNHNDFSNNQNQSYSSNKLVRKRDDNIPTINGNQSQIIYDSRSSGNFTAIQSNNDTIVSNDKKTIKIGRKGKLTIPVSLIEPNREYVLAIECQKINGNGKLMAYVHPTHFDRADLIFATPHNKIINLSVMSGGIPTEDENYKIIITRPESATGDIVISRIMLLTGLNINITKTASATILDYKHSQPSSIRVSYGLQPDITTDDVVMTDVIKYSKYTETFISDQKFENIECQFTINSVSGIRWFNKIKSFFPNITLNKNKEISHNTTVIAPIGHLLPGKNILLEEFKEKKLTEYDKLSLGKASKIFCTTESNCLFLKENFPDANVECVTKFWPFIKPEPLYHIDKQFILVFHRNKENTDMILQAHKPAFAPIVLIGGRGLYPKYVFPTNEYLPYRNIIDLLLNANCIIDIPIIDNYNSGILHLAKACGTSIVTSNSNYFEDENIYKITEKTCDNISLGMELMMNQKPVPSQINNNYNENINNLFSKLL